MGSTAALALGACAPDSTLAPTTAAAPSATASASVTQPGFGVWDRIVSGETGPGSLYEIYVPTSWNGDVVTVAHGFRDAASPVDLRDQDGLYATREALGAQGFAVAYSSYSENGFAVKDGAQRTHQLRGLVASALHRQPAHSYLVGYSLGGAVALSLAEQYPSQYDGALTVCGMVGGSLLQTQYLGHVRALFDAYYPNVLPGSVLGVPAGYTVNPLQVQGAVVSKLPGLFAIASTQQAPLPFNPAAAVPNLLESLITGLSFHARGINNIVSLTHGFSPFDNASTTYSIGTPLLVPPFIPSMTALQAKIDSLNTNVTRYTIDAPAANYLAQHFTPTGDLRVPVITVHNQWDPAVPAFHEAALQQTVAQAGQSANLVQRSVPVYGHCKVPVATALAAFADLTAWVTQGSRPQP
jgi:predicted esterase